MSKPTPKNEEEKLKWNVIGYACNFYSQYNFLYSVNKLYEESPYPWKEENCLVNPLAFKSV